jgi:hypothetical protein
MRACLLHQSEMLARQMTYASISLLHEMNNLDLRARCAVGIVFVMRDFVMFVLVVENRKSVREYKSSITHDNHLPIHHAPDQNSPLPTPLTPRLALSHPNSTKGPKLI